MNRLDLFPEKETLQRYRNVFSSPEGTLVLAHMFCEMGLFEDMPIITPEDAALKNYASRLLKILGGENVKFDAFDVFVKRLMSQPLKEERKDE